MKTGRISAIDVGTTKVCTIVADADATSLRILGVGITSSRGLHKGMVADIGEAREAIHQSIRIAERTAGFRMKSACVGITGRHIMSMNDQGCVAVAQDRTVRLSDLKRAFEASRGKQLAGDRKLLHAIPRTYAVDGQKSHVNPVGMHGSQLDIQTHFITAAEASIQNLTKCIRGTGVKVDNLVLEPLASAEAVLTPVEKHSGVIVADIGGGTTDIAIFKDNGVYHTSVLPVGGYQLTRDIAIGLGLPFALAEEVKKKHGNILTTQVKEQDERVIEDGHVIPYRDLSNIIHSRVDELFRLILLELPHSDYTRFVPSGLVLTGGTANLPGISELGREVTRLPVRIGTPPNLFGVAETLRNPAYSTSVGLLFWNMRNGSVPDWLTRRGVIQSFLFRFSRLFNRSRT